MPGVQVFFSSFCSCKSDDEVAYDHLGVIMAHVFGREVYLRLWGYFHCYRAVMERDNTMEIRPQLTTDQ